MKTQGDSLFDIVDKRDHSAVRAQLFQGSSLDEESASDVTFFCRMNMSRTLKRQSGFGDVKVRLATSFPGMPALRHHKETHMSSHVQNDIFTAAGVT